MFVGRPANNKIMSESISCPVSHIMVNENRVRITAAFVFVASVSYLLVPFWGIPTFLAIDFFLRAFGKARYSLFSVLSGLIVTGLSIGNKPIDQAPKLFAAWIGFVLAVLLLGSNIFSLLPEAYVIAGILVLFSFLESALGFCAGCHVYSLTKKVFPKALKAA
jgi:Domain of unknown function (DUF4395)